MEKILALILAAGSSSRFGRPKQLEKFRGKSLICISIETCLQAGFTNVYVVLGCHSVEIEKEIGNYPVHVCVNKNWRKGMGNSLSFGLTEALLENSTSYEGLLITLADQPFITPDHLRDLYREFTSTKKKVVASGFKDTFGPPLICDKFFFKAIQDLDGDSGAKNLFKNQKSKISVVSFEEAGIDIDEENDVKFL